MAFIWYQIFLRPYPKLYQYQIPSRLKQILFWINNFSFNKIRLKSKANVFKPWSFEINFLPQLSLYLMIKKSPLQNCREDDCRDCQQQEASVDLSCSSCCLWPSLALTPLLEHGDYCSRSSSSFSISSSSFHRHFLN